MKTIESNERWDLSHPQFRQVPELCPELAEFFADRERVDVLIEPLRAAPADQTGGPTVSMAADQGNSSGSAPQMSLTNTELALGDARGGNDGGASDPLQAGTRVRYFGDYGLQKVLGEGGMGIV